MFKTTASHRDPLLGGGGGGDGGGGGGGRGGYLLPSTPGRDGVSTASRCLLSEVGVPYCYLLSTCRGGGYLTAITLLIGDLFPYLSRIYTF